MRRRVSAMSPRVSREKRRFTRQPARSKSFAPVIGLKNRPGRRRTRSSRAKILRGSWCARISKTGNPFNSPKFAAAMTNSRRIEVKTLLTGLAMGESPRWHNDRLWFSDWGAQEIIAVDVDGKSEVAVRVPFALPFCFDWLRDGDLIIVSGREGLLMRRTHDGSMVTHADLRGFSEEGWNEIVVDGRGNAYVNGRTGIVLLPADG